MADTEHRIVEQVIQRWETVTRESFEDEVSRRAFCLQQAIAALQLRFSDDREGPERVIETAERFLAWMTATPALIDGYDQGLASQAMRDEAARIDGEVAP